MKPILFNTEMVKAILDGRKTVTRRSPFKFEMKEGYNPDWSGYSLGEYYTGHIETGVCLYSRGAHDVWGVRSNVVKPKYNVGDILYVRETWCKGAYDCGELPDGRDSGTFVSQCTNENNYIHKELCLRNKIDIEDVVWKPSIHMPKEAARLFLKITGVRVERLQDITEDGVKQEGIEPRFQVKDRFLEDIAKQRFSELWNSTIPTKPPEKLYKFGWKANPWVWVIEFERVSKEVAYAEKL